MPLLIINKNMAIEFCEATTFLKTPQGYLAANWLSSHWLGRLDYLYLIALGCCYEPVTDSQFRPTYKQHNLEASPGCTADKWDEDSPLNAEWFQIASNVNHCNCSTGTRWEAFDFAADNITLWIMHVSQWKGSFNGLSFICLYWLVHGQEADKDAGLWGL